MSWLAQKTLSSQKGLCSLELTRFTVLFIGLYDVTFCCIYLASRIVPLQGWSYFSMFTLTAPWPWRGLYSLYTNDRWFVNNAIGRTLKETVVTKRTSCPDISWRNRRRTRTYVSRIAGLQTRFEFEIAGPQHSVQGFVDCIFIRLQSKWRIIDVEVRGRNKYRRVPAFAWRDWRNDVRYPSHFGRVVVVISK
jgi:hypothetical protein